MKKIKFTKWMLLLTFILLTVVYACKQSFLDKPSLGTLSQSILANDAGVQGLLIGAYRLLEGQGGLINSGWGSACSNWTYGGVASDDAYKGSTPSDQGDIVGLMTWATNPSNSYTAQKWATMYEGIQRANDVLRMLKVATGVTPANQTIYAAEARFLRGYYHSELKKVFGNVPFVDETVTNTSTPGQVSNVDGSGNYVNIWSNIEADFSYAVANLPVTQAQAGRANKWAADAYLAKTYLYEAKYAQAKAEFDKIIPNGVTASGQPYALLTNYGSNFNAAQKNSAESVFAVQMSVNDGSGSAANNGYGSANGNYGDVLNFPYSAGPGACCGFYNPSQALADSYKTDANGLPVANPNALPYVSYPANNYTGNVDPRLDWTVGRPGIPYLDWGPVPVNDAWIRDPSSDGNFSPKKNVYAQSQTGTYSDTENYWANVELDANNVDLIRFADVLLMAAEAEVNAGSLTQAQTYVNQVRARAANPSGFVYMNSAFNANTYTYTTQTTPADKYKVAPYPAGYFSNATIAMTAIMRERQMELGMEGHRFFDLVRWGTAATVLNAYVATDPVAQIYRAGAVFKSTSGIFPIPQGQIDILNTSGKVYLKQNPGY